MYSLVVVHVYRYIPVVKYAMKICIAQSISRMVPEHVHVMEILQKPRFSLFANPTVSVKMSTAGSGIQKIVLHAGKGEKSSFRDGTKVSVTYYLVINYLYCCN